MDKRNLELIELRDIIGQRTGRAVICRIIEKTGYFDDTFTHDPYAHAAANGVRSLGVRLMKEIEREFPGHMLTMLKERIEAMNPTPTTPEDDE